MSQAEVTNALRQKDIEKTLALEEIRNVEIQQSRGFAGKLYVSLIGVRGFDGQSSGASLKYTLSPDNYGEAAPADQVTIEHVPPINLSPFHDNVAETTSSQCLHPNLFKQAKDGIDGHLLIAREVVLSITLEMPIESSTLAQEHSDATEEPSEPVEAPTTVCYYAEFDCRELPEEGYMQLELIGKSEGQLYADLKFVIKVSYDEFDKIIVHKKTELEQIQQQMKDLNNTVKDASRSKTGKVKKTKKVVSGEKNAVYSSEGEDVGPSRYEVAKGTAEAVAVFVVATRSYWLFGVAAVGIFYFGEYASI